MGSRASRPSVRSRRNSRCDRANGSWSSIAYSTGPAEDGKTAYSVRWVSWRPTGGNANPRYFRLSRADTGTSPRARNTASRATPERRVRNAITPAGVTTTAHATAMAVTTTVAWYV